MNKFKKQKVINEIVKMPATRKTVETIVESLKDVNDHNKDYQFPEALESRLGMIIYCVSQGIYSDDIIPNKLVNIGTSPPYKKRTRKISRQLIQRTKEIENRLIIKLNIFSNRRALFNQISSKASYNKYFSGIKFEVNSPPGVYCLKSSAMTNGHDKDLLKKYEMIENKSNGPKEFIENLFSDSFISNYSKPEYLTRNIFTKHAYMKLGITNKEFNKIIKEIRLVAEIAIARIRLKRGIEGFKNETNFPARLYKNDIAMCTIKLCKAGEITEWEPLFKYRIQKNRNKTYANYLKNKDKDGWCKIGKGMSESAVISKLIYTGQAKLEIRGKEEWIKITLI